MNLRTLTLFIAGTLACVLAQEENANAAAAPQVVNASVPIAPILENQT